MTETHERLADPVVAQFSLHLDVGVRMYADEHLGNRSHVSAHHHPIHVVGKDERETYIDLVNRTSFYGLFNGGPAGLVWGYLVTWVGYMLVFASVAEMSSISPTSGGQVRALL